MLGSNFGRLPSDADRARVIAQLTRAGPHLGAAELERRMELARHVPTIGELALVAWDLSVGDVVPSTGEKRNVGAWHNAGFRLHATAYVLTNGALVGTWALTGPHLFWPFFPIAAWGIGLGLHAVGVRNAERHRQDQEQRAPREARLAEGGVDSASGAKNGPEARTPTQVTVMFTDVVDSTRLTATIGDESWTRVRARHREMLGRCYELHRGREVNSIGDGFMARFDSERAAVRCAVEIQQRLDQERREIGFALAIRIGINAGHAIDDDGDLLGNVVNVASRITTAAEPNEILITESVADHVDGHFRLVDRGLRGVKGLDRALHVLSVDWSA